VSLKSRLEKLERTPPAHDYTWAREELIRRLERADPETRARVLKAIREKVEREPQDSFS
jgi:hypothetical protein